MTTFDPSRVDGMFSEPVILPDHQLVLGLMHLDGAGLRVCTWDGSNIRHMSQAAARRLAKSLDEDGLGPVVDGLELLADRIDEIHSEAAERAKQFAEMPVEGHA